MQYLAHGAQTLYPKNERRLILFKKGGGREDLKKMETLEKIYFNKKDMGSRVLGTQVHGGWDQRGREGPGALGPAEHAELIWSLPCPLKIQKTTCLLS